MPPHALFETHLDVRDLKRSITFYRDVVGWEFAYQLAERQVAFFWIGRRGHSMLGLWSGSTSPNIMRLHTAFALDLDAVLAAPSLLRGSGVEPLEFHGRPATEPSVIGWMPAASVFFNDPDGHLLEYLAMLPHHPRPEAGVVAYGEWLTRWAREAGSGAARHAPLSERTKPATRSSTTAPVTELQRRHRPDRVLRLVLDPRHRAALHADPFGFLRPWNEVPALMGSAPPAMPPSTGTGVVVCIMG